MSRHTLPLFLLAAIASLSACQSERGPIWKEFAPEGHGFSVALPGIPTQESLEQQSRVSGYRFALEQEEEGVSHRVEYFDYPPSLIELLTRAGGGTPEKLMFAASRTLAAEIGGEVVDEAQVSLGGLPGREVRIDGPDGTVTLARFHLVGSRLYRLSVGVQGNGPPEQEVRKFFDSFKLLEPRASQDPG